MLFMVVFKVVSKLVYIVITSNKPIKYASREKRKSPPLGCGHLCQTRREAAESFDTVFRPGLGLLEHVAGNSGHKLCLSHHAVLQN